MLYESPLDLLSPEERDLVAATPEEGFISRFINWAAKRTDAPHYSLQSAAFMALSLSCGDTVVMPPLFGSKPTHMNLYVLIVGPSTVLRKTTVLNYVMDLVPKNAQTKQDYVIVLDDVSAQAFNKAAAEAGQTMSPVAFNVDEVAGLFEVVRRKGSYLAGFDKVLMKCYDHSPVHVKRTGSEIIAPRGAFTNIFAASTPEPLMEVLASEDVESGLLPRFLIFDARGARRGERRSLMERMEGTEEWEAEAESLREFLFEVARDRAIGVPLGMEADGKTLNFRITTLKMAPEAVERLDAIDKLFHEEIPEDSSAWGAIKGRAFWHMVKLAGLYAVSRDGREATVQLIDVLRAVDLVETTVADLGEMHAEVGSNSLERSINEALELIRLNPAKAQKQSLIATRMSLSARDAADLARTMVLRDLIIVEKDDHGSIVWRLA